VCYIDHTQLFIPIHVKLFYRIVSHRKLQVENSKTAKLKKSENNESTEIWKYSAAATVCISRRDQITK